MKSIHLAVLALQTSGLAAARQFAKNIPTIEIKPGATIHGNSIEYEDPDCDPAVFTCKKVQTCVAEGTFPTLSDNLRYCACCLPGQRLLGSPETAFDCCANGHDLVGAPGVGYHCCETGYTWDGHQCVMPCSGGKVRDPNTGRCVCPEGQVEGPDGDCRPSPKCDSGLVAGKCYVIARDNGQMLGLRTDNLYWFGPEYAEQRYSKFKFCKDQNCAAGQIIEPSDKILLWDTYGYPKTGLLGGGWLNNAQNGNHIGRTTDVSLAGKFSIGKWSCGKYCLGGFEWGLGPACPTDYPAITFFPNDPQVCFPVEITEVPCDIKQVSNDCNWDDGCDCCKKTGHTEL